MTDEKLPESQRLLKLAYEASARAASLAEAADGNWLYDHVNYFAAQSEARAAERYFAQAKAAEAKEKAANN